MSKSLLDQIANVLARKNNFSNFQQSAYCFLVQIILTSQRFLIWYLKWEKIILHRMQNGARSQGKQLNSNSETFGEANDIRTYP